MRRRSRTGNLPYIIALFLVIVLYSIFVAGITGASFFAILPSGIMLFWSFFIYYRDCKDKKRYQLVAVIILILDLLLVVYNSVYRNLPLTGVDWSNFDYFARKSLSSSENILQIFNNSIDLFTACIAILYKLFGAEITIVYFYILPFSFISAHYLFKTAFLVTNNKSKSILFSLLLLLMPVNLIFSLSVLREIPIQCLSIMSLYYFITYMLKSKRYSLSKAFIYATIATLMHSGMIAILVVYCYVYIQKRFLKSVKMLRASTVIFCALLLIVMSLPILAPLTKRFGGSNNTTDVVSMVSTQNEYLLDASTSYIDSTPNNTAELIVSLPYRVVMFVISPLPWQVHGLDTLIAFFADAIFRYYIVYRVLKTMFNIKKYSIENREVITALFMSIALFDLIFCLGTTNYGQAMRHRTKMLPFELILLAVPQNSIAKEEEIAR